MKKIFLELKVMSLTTVTRLCFLDFFPEIYVNDSDTERDNEGCELDECDALFEEYQQNSNPVILLVNNIG